MTDTLCFNSRCVGLLFCVIKWWLELIWLHASLDCLWRVMIDASVY